MFLRYHFSIEKSQETVNGHAIQNSDFPQIRQKRGCPPLAESPLKI
jgi:hypothetical protein